MLSNTLEELIDSVDPLTRDEEICYYKRIKFMIQDMSYYHNHLYQIAKYANCPIALVHKTIKKMKDEGLLEVEGDEIKLCQKQS